MNRERIEERIEIYFGHAQTTLAAALSEVEGCFAYPEFLVAVLKEMGPQARGALGLRTPSARSPTPGGSQPTQIAPEGGDGMLAEALSTTTVNST
jgi:hypothetical protein